MWGAVFGCASGRVSDLDAYEKVPMNRVVPYPAEAELSKRAYEVIVTDRPAAGIDEAELRAPQAQVHRELEAIAAEAGAVVIDRSLQELAEIRTEGVLSELDGDSAQVSGADFALVSRFNTFRHSGTYSPPFKFLWQTEDDVANKAGSCTHLAEVALDIQVIEIGSNDRLEKTYALEHQAEKKVKQMSSSCPIDEVPRSVLFERALEEALSCVKLPLGRLLSPRGHVTAHRKAPEAERHLYRISLGSRQGIEKGDEIEVRREQRATSPTGEESRSERVIALGTVTDKVMADHAWAVVKPSKSGEAILDGDVVRPVLSEGLLASLSGPSCGKILSER